MIPCNVKESIMDRTSIEIDFDIHKLIEAERRSFAEKPYMALRRLLKLPDVEAPTKQEEVSADGFPWTDDGVIVPHGCVARMEYNRGEQVYEGQFLDGALVVDGQRYKSLSRAASALAKTRNGSTPSLNGWNYWSVKMPGSDSFEPLEHLRLRAHGKAIR
jgi:hypothetical protein